MKGRPSTTRPPCSMESTVDWVSRATRPARYTAPGYPNYCHCHLLDGHCEVLRAALHTVDRRKGAIGREVAPRAEHLAIVAHPLALCVVRLARAVVDERAQRLGVASTQ